jgi:methionyl-tRNA formyltransferase
MIDRVVLAGNNEASTLVLDLLLDRYEPGSILVLATPDSAVVDWQPSLAEHAAKLGIECIQPEDVNAPWVLDKISSHHPKLLLSVYYTKIFSPEFLERIDGPSLNFHPALLPRHRGVAPLIWALVEGDEEAGVSVHFIDEGTDTGPLVLQLRFPIEPDDTGYDLHRKAARAVRSAAANLLDQLAEHGRLPDPKPQEGRSSYHSKREPRLNRIDWTWPRDRVRNVVRALAPPLPGAYAVVGGERWVLCKVETGLLDGRTFPPGTVTTGEPGGPEIWASDGPIVVREAVVADESRTGADLLRVVEQKTPMVLD